MDLKILDEARDQLLDMGPQAAGQAISVLSRGLRERMRAEPEEWDRFVAAGREHPLRELLHQDPLSRRAFTRPRGYQGDAELLDVIYAKDYSGVCDTEPSELGKAIFSFTIECDAPGAVRSRKALLAARLDHVAERVRSPHVLSVACGHLREAGESAAFRRNAFGRLVALDQDPQSLEVVRASLPGTGVETLCGSIKLLLAGAFADQRFDYIYAAGLFDYLDDKLARRVTESMFQLLRPGGTLLVANYLKDIADVGYMEVYMDWRLLYRSLDELLSLSDGIRAAEVASRSCFQDATGNVGYLELARA